MKRKGTIRAAAAVLSLFMALNMGGCSFRKADYTISMKGVMSSGTAFRLNQQRCPASEAKLYYANYRNLYGNSSGLNLWTMAGEDASEESLDEFVKAVSQEELTRIYSMDQLAQQQNIELSGEDKQSAEEMAASYYNSLTEEEISFIGASEEDYTTFYEHYILAEKLYDQLTIGVSTEVSEDEARIMQVNVMTFTDKETADKAYARIQKGEKYVTVASTMNNGGQDKYISRDTYSEEVTDILFTMENEAVSEVLSDGEKNYIFYIENKYVEDLTDQNKSNVLKSRKLTIFENSYSIFAEDAFLEINDRFWNRLSVDDPEEIITSSFFRTYEEMAQTTVAGTTEVLQ